MKQKDKEWNKRC